MWPFSKKTTPNLTKNEFAAELCVVVTKVVFGTILHDKSKEMDAARSNFMEVIALCAFGCYYGLKKGIQQQDRILEIEKMFHNKLITGLIEFQMLPEIDRQKNIQFLRHRQQEYHAVLAEYSIGCSEIDLDGFFQDVGVIFIKACLGPEVDLKNPNDASKFLALKWAATQIMNNCIDSTVKGLSMQNFSED
jgi:hypothetical protein